MKTKNLFNRTHKPIKGAEVAKAPRSHAHGQADENAKRQNPQRLDIIKRHMLSSRKKDDI